MYEKVVEDLRAAGCEVYEDKKLAPYTSFKTGGSADVLCLCRDGAVCKKAYGLILESGLPYFIAGKLSNTLVSDNGFRGIVLRYAGESVIKKTDGGLEAGGGVSLSALCYYAAQNNLGGAEFLASVPGTLGGEVTGNAGCFGSETKDLITEVKGMKNGQPFCLSAAESEFSYRNSAFKNTDCLILSVKLKLKERAKEISLSLIRDIFKQRRETQPQEASAGSIFRRDGDIIPAKLIDDCGLKGLLVGGAQVSRKHAGFIVNTGCANSKDIYYLISDVRERVRALTGILLKEEINYLGEFRS